MSNPINGSRKSSPNFTVIGSGMAAFGAAHRLSAQGITPVMFDKNSYHGGHTTSMKERQRLHL